MKRIPPLHPILFGVAPILFVYAHNVRNIPVRVGELVLPIVATLGLTLVLWLLLAVVLRNWTKSAGIVTLFLILFFLYGHLQHALGGLGEGQGLLVPALVVLVAAGLILILRARGD